MKQAKKRPAPVALDGEGAQAVELDGERVSVSPSTANINRSPQAAQRARPFTPEQIAKGRQALSRAEAWRSDNPQAWACIVSHALDLAAQEQPIAARSLIESVRKKAFVDAHGRDTRTDNNHGAIFARWLVREHPQTAQYVVLRRSVADVLIGGHGGR